MHAGSWWTAPAGPEPGRQPHCAAAAPPAPSRPCGPGWAGPAQHAGTCGRAERTAMLRAGRPLHSQEGRAGQGSAVCAGARES